jgi:hypothetical protein
MPPWHDIHKMHAVNPMDTAVNGYSDHTQLPGFLTRETKRSFRD